MKFLRHDITKLEDILAECWLQFYNLDTPRLHQVFDNAKRLKQPTATLTAEDTKALYTILAQANQTCPWLGVSDILAKVRQEVL